MKIISLALPEVKIIEPRIFADERGVFLESYNYRRFSEHGIPEVFVQDNHSQSVCGTIRGLHYQKLPGQAKLVRVVRGSILDVAVDVRLRSPTFGAVVTCRLSAENRRMLYVPVGFAHGFCVLDGPADVVYKVDTYYDPALERGIRYDDPALDIEWPTDHPVVSDRDRELPFLADADLDFRYEGATI